MKNNNVLLYVFTFHILCFISINGDYGKTHASMLESHLPESPYSLVLNLCMQAWGESHMQQEAQSKDDFFLIHDLVVGRLVRLQKYITALKNTAAEKIILLSDVSYLLTILASMEEEQKKIDEKSVFFKEHLIFDLLQAIKKEIIEFL